MKFYIDVEVCVCVCVCECEEKQQCEYNDVLNSHERGEGGVGAKARHQSSQPTVANVIINHATL